MHHHHLGEKVRMERKVVMANHEICSFCRHVEILFILSYVLLWITRSFFNFFFFNFFIIIFFFFVLDCFMHHPRFFFFFFLSFIFSLLYLHFGTSKCQKIWMIANKFERMLLFSIIL